MTQQDNNEYFDARFGESLFTDTLGYYSPGYIKKAMQHYTHMGIVPIVKNNETVSWAVNYKKMGTRYKMTANEYNFIDAVLRNQFNVPKSYAAPSIKRIANLMGGISEQSVRNVRKKLVDVGLLTIVPRNRRTNIYLFDELIRQAKLWQEFWATHDPDDERLNAIDSEAFVDKKAIKKFREQKILGRKTNKVNEIKDIDLNNVTNFDPQETLRHHPLDILRRRNKLTRSNKTDIRTISVSDTNASEEPSSFLEGSQIDNIEPRNLEILITSDKHIDNSTANNQNIPSFRRKKKEAISGVPLIQIGVTQNTSMTTPKFKQKKKLSINEQESIRWVHAILDSQGMDASHYRGREDNQQVRFKRYVRVATNLRKQTQEWYEQVGDLVIRPEEHIPDYWDWLTGSRRKDGKQFDAKITTIETMIKYWSEYIQDALLNSDEKSSKLQEIEEAMARSRSLYDDDEN